MRLMTVHRAKGLEFPVVCVADLGKDGREDYGRCASPTTARPACGWPRSAAASLDSARARADQGRSETKAGEEEERRIFYVAATRAQEHLVLSGATDLEKRPRARRLKEPMRWSGALLPGLPGEGAAGAWTPATSGRRARGWRLPPATLPSCSAGTRARGPRRRRRPSRQLELGALPAPRALPVSRLSLLGLEAYKRCSYRFYLERALRLPTGRAAARAPSRCRRAPGLGALLRGTLVHELLERLDFRRPRCRPDEEVAALIERHGGDGARPEEVADLRDMVERFAGSALCERLARRRARADRAAVRVHARRRRARGGRSLLVNGFVDVHAEEDDRLLIVDYKSDALDGRDPAELTAEGVRDPAARLRAGRAALGRAEGRGGLLLPRAARTSRPSRRSPAPTPAARGSAARAGPRRRGGPLRAQPHAASASSAPTAPDGPRSAPGTRAAHARRAPDLRQELSFRQVPHLLSDRTDCANRRRARADASLLHRAPGSDQGRRRERRPRGTPPAARRGRARVGRRDPRRRADGPLRQGRRRARRRRPLDPRRLARLARGRPADRQQGVPARRLRRARRAPPRGAPDRRRLQGRRRLRSRGQRGAGTRHRAALALARPAVELAAEAVELYCWDRLGSDN